MERKMEQFTVIMDINVHSKLMLISLAYRFGNKNLTASQIIRDAVDEYLKNHPELEENAREEFAKRGWKVDL